VSIQGCHGNPTLNDLALRITYWRIGEHPRLSWATWSAVDPRLSASRPGCQSPQYAADRDVCPHTVMTSARPSCNTCAKTITYCENQYYSYEKSEGKLLLFNLLSKGNDVTESKLLIKTITSPVSV
jgi:hypothetical protein